MIRVAFRVDGSRRIGSGHVARCLTLADELRARGCECLFVHRDHPGGLADEVRRRGYPVQLLSAPPAASGEIADDDYAAWLGVTQEEDAVETADALSGGPIDWLIVDHYGIGEAWHSQLRDRVGRIAVIDDLANRRLDCDLLLDQNFFSDPGARYRDLVPDHAGLLLGPSFALLGPEYRQARAFLRPRRGPISRVLVYYGGSDLTGETARALRVLQAREFRSMRIDVVAGSNTAELDAVARSVDALPGATLHTSVPSLVDLMVAADVCLGGGGTTTWERCCLGLPSLVIAIAPNQEPICTALAEAGVIRYVGATEDVSDRDVAREFRHLLQEDEQRAREGAKAWSTVDGKGANRVADRIDHKETCMDLDRITGRSWG